MQFDQTQKKKNADMERFFEELISDFYCIFFCKDFVLNDQTIFKNSLKARLATNTFPESSIMWNLGF